MTTILIHDPDAFSLWRSSFAALDGDFVCVEKPLGATDLASIRYCLVWNPPMDFFDDLPALEVIFSTGAGVDHILRCASLPKHVPIVRLDDVMLKNEMSEFVLLQVLSHHRNMHLYQAQQRKRLWRQHLQQPAHETCVGIMGLGTLGRHCAITLRQLNFQVKGWSYSKKSCAGVTCYGHNELSDFLQGLDILVCLLPLTPQTRGIVNADVFQQLPQGAAFVNVGRGDLIVEADILAALASGQLSHAYLDVFSNEPLAASHVFWQHEQITVTPHIASQTWPPTSAQHVIDNIVRYERGEPMQPIYDYDKGY